MMMSMMLSRAPSTRLRLLRSLSSPFSSSSAAAVDPLLSSSSESDASPETERPINMGTAINEAMAAALAADER